MKASKFHLMSFNISIRPQLHYRTCIIQEFPLVSPGFCVASSKIIISMGADPWK